MPPGLVLPPRPGLSTTTTTTTVAAGTPEGARRTRSERPDILGHLIPPTVASTARSLLPPLPHDRSSVRSSSPRHHSFTPARLSRTFTAPEPPSLPLQLPSTPSLRSAHSTPARRNPAQLFRRASQPTRNFEAPSNWADDLLDLSPESIASENQILAAFADEDFSSPSTYPSFTNPPPARGNGSRTTQNHQASAPTNNSSAPRLFPHFHEITSDTTSLPTTQLSSSTDFSNDSQRNSFNDSFATDYFCSDSTSSSFSENMPTSRKRGTAAVPVLRDTAPASKRRRTSINAAHARGQSTDSRPAHPASFKDFDDLFGDSPGTNLDDDDDDLKHEDLTPIDLTEANEVPEELLKPDVDTRTKISAFQCAICMDNVTALTVTHCGHLYCAQCLHMSLHVEATRGRCPMCRSKIDIKARESYTTKTKGFWPLELKLMTAARKGKRKADAL